MEIFFILFTFGLFILFFWLRLSYPAFDCFIRGHHWWHSTTLKPEDTDQYWYSVREKPTLFRNQKVSDIKDKSWVRRFVTLPGSSETIPVTIAVLTSEEVANAWYKRRHSTLIKCFSCGKIEVIED